MIAELSTALSSLKGMADWLSLVAKQKKDAAMANEAAKYLSVILSVQETALRVIEENKLIRQEKEQLEKKLIELEQWRDELPNYELKQMGRGSFAYVKKRSEGDSSPEIKFCAQCFENKKKSILQLGPDLPSQFRYLSCNACGSKVFY